MSEDIASLNTKLNSVYTLNANNIFSNSQVKSTKVLQASPTQLLVKWDCSKDSDCTANSETPDRIDDSCMLKFNVYYSSIDASVKNMTFAVSVDYNPGKLYADDYELLISGLQSDTTYYVWVTSVIDGEQVVELSDNSNVRVAKTMTLESVKVTNLVVSPVDGTTLSISWKDGLTGGEKSEYVKGYQVYWSEYELTSSNVLSCSNTKTVTSCSVTVEDLVAGTYYYVVIVPLMQDMSVSMNEIVAEVISIGGSMTAFRLTYSLSPSNASSVKTSTVISYVNIEGNTVKLDSGSGSVYVKPGTKVIYTISASYTAYDHGVAAYSCYWNNVCIDSRRHTGTGHTFVNSSLNMDRDYSIELSGSGYQAGYLGNGYVGDWCYPVYEYRCSGGATIK